MRPYARLVLERIARIGLSTGQDLARNRRVDDSRVPGLLSTGLMMDMDYRSALSARNRSAANCTNSRTRGLSERVGRYTR